MKKGISNKKQSKLSIIPISKIVVDEEIYPRNKWSWQQAYTYANAMRMGEKFPPICVALSKGAYVLVDGKHRLEAHSQIQSGTKGKPKSSKNKLVQCEVLHGLTMKEIWLESVKRNMKNGLPFSAFDKVKIIKKLQDWKFSAQKISEVVMLPVDKVAGLNLTKMTHTISGDTIALKGTVKNVAGTTVADNFDSVQEDFEGSSQQRLLADVCVLIENNLLNLNHNLVLTEWNRLVDLIATVNVAKRSEKKRRKK